MSQQKKSHIQSTRISQLSFPIILRPVKQVQKQSNTNKSLFKQDSSSSLEQQKIQHELKPFQSRPQIEKIKNIIKKDNNNLDVGYHRKLLPQRTINKLLPYQRSSGSLYKFVRQCSVENIEEKQKQIRKAYLNKSIKFKRDKYISGLGRKIIKATKQVQTQRVIAKQPPIQDQSQKVTIKQINPLKTINHPNLKSNRYQKDLDQQLSIPKKNIHKKGIKSVSINPKQGNSNNIQQYLQSMSKTNYNFNQQVKRYSKKQIQYQNTVFHNNNQSIFEKAIMPQIDGFTKNDNNQQRDKLATTGILWGDTIANSSQTKNIKPKINQTIDWSQIKKDNNIKNQSGINNSNYNNYSRNSNHSQNTPKSNKINNTLIKNDPQNEEAISVFAQKFSVAKNTQPTQYPIIHNYSSKITQQLSNKKNNEISIQVPQISQIKIGNVNQHEKHIKIHPIRIDCAQNAINWITSQFRPKSQMFKKIDLNTFKLKKYRNGVYFGELDQEGRKSGKGIIFYYNGRIYQGSFQGDLKHGKGFEGFPDGSKYTGEFQKGIKQGKGSFQWSNGQIYDGQWLNGKKNGSGMWKSTLGQSYIGEWKSGKVQGFGVYLMGSGDRYEGQFINSLKHGLGTERYHNGDTYVGYYRKNRPNGQGEFYSSNGDYYKGMFSNGLRHGQGLFKQQKTKNVYKGQFLNDKQCGFGEMKYGNGQVYVGNFENNLQHGFGELYKDGMCLFKGYWINGERVDQSGTPIIYQQPERQETLPNIKNPKPRKAKILKKSKSPHSTKQSPQNRSLQRTDTEDFMRACGCKKKH